MLGFCFIDPKLFEFYRMCISVHCFVTASLGFQVLTKGNLFAAVLYLFYNLVVGFSILQQKAQQRYFPFPYLRNFCYYHHIQCNPIDGCSIFPYRGKCLPCRTTSKITLQYYNCLIWYTCLLLSLSSCLMMRFKHTIDRGVFYCVVAKENHQYFTSALHNVYTFI